MGEGHGQFEALVVGHVLDDLTSDDAARFRSHLMGCRDCRARVAELRGIAAELADVEREELERASVRTEVPRRHADGEAQGLGPPRISVMHVTVAAIVVLALAAAMGFWNLHLRAESATYLAVAEARGDSIDGLVRDAPLPVDLTGAVSGVVTGDGQRVSLALVDVPELADGELYVAWFLDVPGAERPGRINLARPGQIPDGTLAVTLEDPGAARLVVTTEARATGQEPLGAELIDVQLPAGD